MASKTSGNVAHNLLDHFGYMPADGQTIGTVTLARFRVKSSESAAEGRTAGVDSTRSGHPRAPERSGLIPDSLPREARFYAAQEAGLGLHGAEQKSDIQIIVQFLTLGL